MNVYVMVNPTQLAGADHTVFMSDDGAEAMVTGFLRSFGWLDIIDLGYTGTARGAEILLPI